MISKVLSDLKAYRTPVDRNPIFERLARGELTSLHYLAYLRESYHLVKHTPKYLTLAADRVADTDERLAAYFRNFCREETGHDALCVRDIEALGQDPDQILSGDQNPGVWGIVTQCYFWAAHGNPISLLGDAFATEEIGVAHGLNVARMLETNYRIPHRATNFLRVHGSEDQEHLEAAARVIERYIRDAGHYDEIVYATKMTYRYYGQLFDDVLEVGNNWTKAGSPI